MLVIEHETHAGLDLMAGDPGLRATVVRPYLGDRLPDRDELSRFGGLIVLGGSMGAWDDDVAPWLPATRRLIAAAVTARVPTLGICLGAQLIGAACGGTVKRGEPGLEVGVVAVTPTAAAASDPFFGSVGPLTAVSQYHFDAVTELPADAELMITSDRYPHQGFRVGEAAWAVQYHPEVSTAAFTGWVAGGLTSGDLDQPAATAVLERVRAHDPTQRRLAAAHARAFAEATTLDR